MSAKPIYLSLRTAAQRLSALRAKSLEHGKPWKACRDWGFNSWEEACGALSQRIDGKATTWICHTGEQFRNERFADECSEAPRYVSKHTGYFSNEDCSEKVRGIVANLTHGRLIAGYYWSSCGVRVYFGGVYTEEREAAIAADGHAESYAEVCREDDEQYQAARRLEDENETSMHRLRECLTLRNNPCFDYVRSEISDLLESIRNNREELRTTYAQYQ